jgi:hypothetical protein
LSTRFFHQLTLCILAMTITVQGQAAVARICHAAGNVSQVVSNLSNHLVHEHHTQEIGAEGTALMASSGHGLNGFNTDAPLGEKGFEPLSHHDAPEESSPSNSKCSYCASVCAMAYVPSRPTAAAFPPGEVSLNSMAPLQNYKNAILEGPLRPPRS